MYAFLSELQLQEPDRLIARSNRLKANPMASIMDRALGERPQKKKKKNKGKAVVDSSDDSDNSG